MSDDKKLLLIDQASGNIYKCDPAHTLADMRKFFHPNDDKERMRSAQEEINRMHAETIRRQKEAINAQMRAQAWTRGWPFK